MNAAQIQLRLFMVERAKRVWLSDSLEFGFSFFFKVWVFMYLTQNHLSIFPQTIHLNDKQGVLKQIKQTKCILSDK